MHKAARNSMSFQIAVPSFTFYKMPPQEDQYIPPTPLPEIPPHRRRFLHLTPLSLEEITPVIDPSTVTPRYDYPAQHTTRHHAAQAIYIPFEHPQTEPEPEHYHHTLSMCACGRCPPDLPHDPPYVLHAHPRRLPSVTLDEAARYSPHYPDHQRDTFSHSSITQARFDRRSFQQNLERLLDARHQYRRQHGFPEDRAPTFCTLSRLRHDREFDAEELCRFADLQLRSSAQDHNYDVEHEIWDPENFQRFQAKELREVEDDGEFVFKSKADED